MQKDVIYIDVEDDITAIIGKVKASKEKIVALVPPKRIGILQSAVNLRLLGRAAEQGSKHLVLITSNQALMALSASAKIPVAKNLQSKPEIAVIPTPDGDNGEDVIDGELAQGADSKSTNDEDQIVGSIEDAGGISAIKSGTTPKARVRNDIKVPSFNTFRKKLFIGIGLICLLIGFLVWAIVYAPHATVVIDARTTPTEIKTAVAIGPELATNAETGALKSVAQTEKKAATVDFDATGTQDIGDKATGTVKFSTSSFAGLGTIPAGTALQSTGGLTFTTNSAVTLAYSGGTSATGTTTVTAAERGTKYNGATGSLSGAPSSVTAAFTDATAGGTEKVIKIVLQADVEKAKAQLVALKNEEVKKALQSKFGSNTILIEDSFQATPTAPISTPDVGGESKDGKAKLTSEVTYTMHAIAKVDLSAYLKAALEKQLDKDQQRVYNDGLSTAKLTGFTQNNGNTSITLTAMGQIGPKINDNKIRDMVKGKKAAEIREELKQIEGVNDAETKFSPFWVNVVPSDSKKIKIEFKLQDESKS